jgi:low affinity Fe/Cu permease
MNQLFSQISTAVAYQTGRSTTFSVALPLVLIWFATASPAFPRPAGLGGT